MRNARYRARVPPDPRALALDALLAVERREGFAKDCLEAPRAAVTDPRDRGLLTEIVYGTIRRRATIDAALAAFSRVPVEALDPTVRAALRMAVEQVLFLDRVPAFAAVHASVGLVSARTNRRFAGFANAVLRNLVRAIERRDVAPADREDPLRDVPRPGSPSVRFRRPLFPDPADDLAGNLARRYAHPAFLVSRWLSRHGEATARAMLAAGASRPPVVLRAKPGEREALLVELRAAGVPAKAGLGPDAVHVAEGDPAAIPAVKEGRAHVQDETAQRVVPLLGLSGGERVLDLCAAPGGKAIHASDLLDRAAADGRGGGEVVACDIEPERVVALQNALAKAIAGRRATVVAVPDAGPLPFPGASFDAVLVDAPCSNTGVLRRRVEARDRLREADIAALSGEQAALLARALPLAKPGGRVVYATCSVEPEENEAVVAATLGRYGGWRSGGGFSVLPSETADGGFAAVLLAPTA